MSFSTSQKTLPCICGPEYGLDEVNLALLKPWRPNMLTVGIALKNFSKNHAPKF